MTNKERFLAGHHFQLVESLHISFAYFGSTSPDGEVGFIGRDEDNGGYFHYCYVSKLTDKRFFIDFFLFGYASFKFSYHFDKLIFLEGGLRR